MVDEKIELFPFLCILPSSVHRENGYFLLAEKDYRHKLKWLLGYYADQNKYYAPD